jgi:syntaxin 5
MSFVSHKNVISRGTAVRYPKKPKYIQSYAGFMTIARTIGKNIGSAYIKLEKLNLLAKRKIIFQ